MLSTFGLSIVIDNLLFEAFGADTRSLAPSIGDLSYRQLVAHRRDRDRQARGADLRRAPSRCSAASSLFLDHTPIGRAIRATAEDPDTAGLVGVNARARQRVAAAIAMATVAVAGALLGMRATFDPYAGAPQLIFAFEAVGDRRRRDRCGGRSPAGSCSASRKASAR